MVLIAKFANIWTKYDENKVFVFSLRYEKIIPPAKRPASKRRNTGIENQPIIMAIW